MCMTYICRLRLYGSDITTRKKGYHIVKVIQVYSWFLYHIFRCIIWRGVAFFEKLPPAVILRMLSDKMVSQSLHFWLLILGTGKSMYTKHIKGQMKSECIFEIINFPKYIPPKKFDRFLPWKVIQARYVMHSPE